MKLLLNVREIVKIMYGKKYTNLSSNKKCSAILPRVNEWDIRSSQVNLIGNFAQIRVRFAWIQN